MIFFRKESLWSIGVFLYFITLTRTGLRENERSGSLEENKTLARAREKGGGDGLGFTERREVENEGRSRGESIRERRVDCKDER